MDNKTETDEKRGSWRWFLVASLCWLTSALSIDRGFRSVLLGLGMYLNVVLIDHFISWRKSDYLIIRLLSAIVFMLPCVFVTWILLRDYSPPLLNGTKTVLLLSPIVYGVMFYLGVYVSEKLKCPNWLTFLIILFFMVGAGLFRVSALLRFSDLYGFALISAFGLVSMITCIVCGGLFISSKNVIVFSGLLLIVGIVGFPCNVKYWGEYGKVLFMAGKQNPEILERSDYVLAVKKEWSNSDSVQLIFNHTGINADNLEIRNDWIYNTKTDQKVAKLIHNDDKDIDIVITPDLALKFIYNSNEIYLENVKDKKKILIAHGHSPSYAEVIQRIFYINDGKVYSKNLSGKDEIFHCDIDQFGKCSYSFICVSPDGKLLLYNGPRRPLLELSLSAVLELSSGKSHLIPEKCWRKTTDRYPKAWLSKKLLTKDVKQ